MTHQSPRQRYETEADILRALDYEDALEAKRAAERARKEKLAETQYVSQRVCEAMDAGVRPNIPQYIADFHGRLGDSK